MGAGDREMMCQLLGSTNKVEVLKNMEFFRIAWEYQYDGAEMPHSKPTQHVNRIAKNMIECKPTFFFYSYDLCVGVLCGY